MFRQRRRGLTRRLVIAGAPAGFVAVAVKRGALAQPAAADPVSFYLGQVLALATLQAEAVRRIRPFLAVPAPQDVDWQATTTAEAGVIGAVAAVLGAMEPPPELTESVGELRLASTAYQSAAAAAQRAAAGDTAALTTADARLAEGAVYILLWLDALTAETANDWGDGVRTLTLGAAPVPVQEIDVQPPPAAPVDPAAEEPGDGVPADAPGGQQARGERGRGRSRQQREDRAAVA